METIRSYENFPAPLVAAAVLVNVSIYALGAFILAGYGSIMTVLYLLYCLGNDVHIMKMSCVDCCYYGKWCAFGKGKAAALFFKQGDPQRFLTKIITRKDLAMDMLVVMFPLVGGTVLLIRAFSWGTAIALVFLLFFSFYGNYLIRSRVACACCKQRELGCPAARFFDKETKGFHGRR
jgi:hypothetical protein